MSIAGTPTRTITLLFTDIEGSTRLLRESGEQYGMLLEEHRSLVRKAFARHDGREIGTEGDSFFAVFDSAREAVRAAVAIQQTLAGPEWPFAQRVRVRIGIDTGEPTVDDDHVIGLVVHRAARICAAGNGGQVLLSSATQSVLGEHEIAGIALLDLGSHALKDFGDGEHLYQLLIDGLPADLRPPRTGPGPEVFAEGEEGVLKAVEAGITLVETPPSAPAGGPHGWLAWARRPVVAAVRSPAGVLAVLLVILGLALTPWLVVAGVVVLGLAIALKAGSLRREEAYSVASRVFVLEGVAPDPQLAALLHEVGFLLMTAREQLRIVGGYLADHDPTSMQRELKRRRATAASLESAVKIDSLASQVEALVALTKRDAAVQDVVRRFAPRVDEIRAALFEARLEQSSRDELVAQLRTERTSLEVVVNGLRAQLTIAKGYETRGMSERRRKPFSARVRGTWSRS